MEHITTPKVVNVRMIDRLRNSSVGTLYLTATHLIFVDPETDKETWILYMYISSLEKMPLTTTGSPLLIQCKHFLAVKFVFPMERDCHEVHVTLTKLSHPTTISNLYCFQYNCSSDNYDKSIGWDYVKLSDEYKRMGLPNNKWSLCRLNENYELCDTYPSQIYVPSHASEALLVGSSKFRSRGRLPVLTYLHRNDATITRCSQPLAGFSARCFEDEQMMQAIRMTNSNCSYMYVVDTRPKINAMANRAAGKGYENEAFYENTKFHFFGIENIHAMRLSLQKMVGNFDQKPTSMNVFLKTLESSGWLKHIRAILETSEFIAKAINQGTSVVVHCSDGWDRTAQVCSLAALMLDPYYRTIKGFEMLIEKDWLGFGHKFTDRNGHVQSDPREISPVFTQFLDCTWQLMENRTDLFEFNEKFLLTLHDHLHSCQFGTFVGNCEKERRDLKLSETTYSLWGYIGNHLEEFENPLYQPNGSSETEAVMIPNLMPQIIHYWRGMYNRFETGVHPREPIGDHLLASRDNASAFENQVQSLTDRISAFKGMLTSSAKKFQNNSSKSNHSGNSK